MIIEQQLKEEQTKQSKAKILCFLCKGTGKLTSYTSFNGEVIEWFVDDIPVDCGECSGEGIIC